MYSLVKENKIDYETIKELEPKRFQDLEYTMKLIFNHDEDAIKKEEISVVSSTSMKGSDHEKQDFD